MEFYILPNEVDNFRKKFDKMASKLTNPPMCTIDKPKQELVRRNYVSPDMPIIFNSNDTCKKYFVTLRRVVIEDIKFDEWTLVASIFHRENIVSMMNRDHFVVMPKHFGVDYIKCDFCGKNESRRVESHVLYNEVTHEWKQVGTSCINKAFGGSKYFAEFMYKLYDVIQLLGFTWSGDENDDFGGGRPIPDHFLAEAVEVERVIPVVCNYRENVMPIWEKVEYSGDTKYEGTTDLLNAYMVGHPAEINHEYNAKVFEFVNTLECDENNADDFNTKIKRAFECGYISRYEAYLIFFAVLKYEESLCPFTEKLAEAGVVSGEKFRLRCSILREKMFVDRDYIYEFILRDENTGLIFVKRSSTPFGIDKYKIGDNLYEFTSKIGYISHNTRIIYLRGRLSK